MLYLFHGDNQAESRKNFLSSLNEAKSRDVEIIALDGSKLTLPQLEQDLATSGLFQETYLAIENLLSRPLSKEKKSLVSALKSYKGSKNIFLWEKKELTKAQVSALGPSVKALLSKTPAIIFKFLDSLEEGSGSKSLKLMHETAKQVEEGFIFAMLTRHVADLIMAMDGSLAKVAPWKKSRLLSQSKKFSRETLLNLHTSLISIDRKLKTGGTKLSYLSQLDLMLLKVLG